MAVAARFQKRGRIPASAPRPHFNNNRSLVRQSFHLCVPRNCRLDPKPLPRLAASSIRPLTATLALCLPSSSGTRKVDPAADSRLITACFFVCGTILLPATTYVYEPSPTHRYRDHHSLSKVASPKERPRAQTSTMRPHATYSAMLAPFILLASAPLGVLAADILKTNGFSSCLDGQGDIKVNKLNIEFDRSTKKVTFDVSGTNEVEQKVMATLTVNAYGRELYNKEFDPCSGEYKVDQLCPGTYMPALRLLLLYANVQQFPRVPLVHRASRAFPIASCRRSPASPSTYPTSTVKPGCNSRP